MKTSEYLETGKTYSRDQLIELFDISDSTINTGVFHPRGHDSIWLFVTENKTSDRTQYSDFLDGDMLSWDGQTSGRTDEQIINHKQNGIELLLFYRKEKYEFPHAAFLYQGSFEYVSHQGAEPAQFILKRSDVVLSQAVEDTDGYLEEEASFQEGQIRTRLINLYERNPQLRAEAIRIHGMVCRVCGFNFQQVYGSRGIGYIEVHHLVPISTAAGPVQVNPRTDMTVLCANCHRMIHRKKTNPLSVEELIIQYNQNREHRTQH